MMHLCLLTCTVNECSFCHQCMKIHQHLLKKINIMSPPPPPTPSRHRTAPIVSFTQTFYASKSNNKTEQQRQQSVGVAQSG